MNRAAFLIAGSSFALLPATHGADVQIPVELRGGRFFAVPKTRDGATFVCWLDTSGSGFIFSSAVHRLKLSTHREEGRTYAQLPAFSPDASIPNVRGGELPVIDPEPHDPILNGFDAQLGGSWFTGRIWRFDYVARSVTMLAHGITRPGTIDLTFQDGYPQLPVDIAGDRLMMSFDSAASIADPPQAGPRGVRATSFIRSERFDRWRARHPDWNARDVANGIQLIEVPQVRAGVVPLGAVTFSTRPSDDVFEGETVDGKLGANAVANRSVTIDYVSRRLQL